MKRIPEPELMDDAEQAAAYHRADFSEAHNLFVDLFRELFGTDSWKGPVLDLGCGTADVTLRFARAFQGAEIDAIDGAEAMLRLARETVDRQHLSGRIRLFCRHLPTGDLPQAQYGAVISNSLLHHLQDPLTLWRTARAYSAEGAPILVMDLLRPETPIQAERLMNRYAAGEAELLRRDFFNSLCAAYRLEEVEEQLWQAELRNMEVRVVSDRHWVAWGRA